MSELVVLFHFAFVLFVIGGGLIALKQPRSAWLHVPAAAWGALIEFAGWICPLTPLENWLRAQAGGSVYSSGFLEHYLMPIIYPGGLTEKRQMVLGGIVITLNLFVYALVMRKKKSASPTASAASGYGKQTLPMVDKRPQSSIRSIIFRLAPARRG